MPGGILSTNLIRDRRNAHEEIVSKKMKENVELSMHTGLGRKMMFVGNPLASLGHEEIMSRKMKVGPELSFDYDSNAGPIFLEAPSVVHDHGSPPPILDIDTIVNYLEAANDEKFMQFMTLSKDLEHILEDADSVAGDGFEENVDSDHLGREGLLQFTTLEEHLGPAILPLEVPDGYYVPYIPRRAFGVVNGAARPPHGHASFYDHRPRGMVGVANSPAFGFLFSGYRRFQPPT